jgi:hypothetical protein
MIPASYVNTYYLRKSALSCLTPIYATLCEPCLIGFILDSILYPTARSKKLPVAFPEGLRMVSGDPYRRTFDPKNPDHQAISFVCLTGDSHSGKPLRHTVSKSTDGEVRSNECYLLTLGSH